MRNCEQYRDLAALLPDGELSPKEEAALRSHAGTCPECQKCLEQYESLSRALREPDIEPPDTLAYSIMNKLPKKKKTRPVRYLSGVAAAACLAVATLLAARYGAGWPLPQSPLSSIEAGSGLDEQASASNGFAESMLTNADETPSSIYGDAPTADFHTGSGQADAADSGRGFEDYPESPPKIAPGALPPGADVSPDTTGVPEAARTTEALNEPTGGASSAFTEHPQAEDSLPLPNASEYRLAFVAERPIPDTDLAGEFAGVFYCLYPKDAGEFEALIAKLTGERFEGTGDNYIVVFNP